MNLRRLGLFALIVALLPTAVGFLSVGLNLFHDEPATPWWIPATRFAVSWLGVIAVYAYLVRQNRRRWPARVAVVLVLSWLAGLVFQSISVMILQALPQAPQFNQVFSAGALIAGFGISLARAALGSALGLALPPPRTAAPAPPL